MHHYPSPTHITPQLAAQPVESLDKAGKALLVMPFENVLAQKLGYAMVLGVLRENRPNSKASSAGKKIYLHRTHTPQGYLWDIINGPVLAGEAHADAFIRLLHEQFPETRISNALNARLLHMQHLPEPELFISLFAAWSSLHTTDDTTCGMFIDEQELAGLLQSCPEILSSSLHWAAATRMLFSGGKGERL